MTINIEKPPKNNPSIEAQGIICSLCKLESKNLDDLKTHILRIHATTEGNKNEQDDMERQELETCSKCPECTFNANRTELDKHLQPKHSKKHCCEKCGDTLDSVEAFGSHILKKHENPSSIEPFLCDGCSLVPAYLNLLQEHLQMYHPAKVMRCSNCEFSNEDEESLKSHMTECHVGMEAGWHMYKMCFRCSN